MPPTVERSPFRRVGDWLLGPPDEQATHPMPGENQTASDQPKPQRRRRAPAEKLETAIVHLKTDQTIKGALASVDERVIVLKHASLAVSGPSGSVQWSRMDGEIVVALENVDFWQTGLDAAMLDRSFDAPGR